MDYENLMNKRNPFEGLSLEEKKRLYVYMCHIAHPCYSADEINQKWGCVLSQSDMPTVFEALEIVEAITRENNVRGSDEQTAVSKQDKRYSVGCVIGVIILILFIVFIGVVLSNEQVKAERRERVLVEEQRKADAERFKEDRRQEKLRKERFCKELDELEDAANTLLLDKNATSEELLEMGLKLQCERSRTQNIEGISEESKILLDELLLKCYKNGAKTVYKYPGNYKNTEKILVDKFAAEASYRLAVLYLPQSYIRFLKEEDRVYNWTSNNEISYERLKASAEFGHYKALSLLSNICLEKRDEYKRKHQLDLDYYRQGIDYGGHRKGVFEHLKMLESIVSYYFHKLADHPDATSGDVYQYAYWIKNSSPDESLKYLKKAVEMGDAQAKQELLKRKRDAMNKGNVIE